MNIIEIINKKKNKEKLTPENINFMITKYLAKEIEDYQMSSLLMAIRLNGLDLEETICLTKEMINSGDILTYPNNSKIIADKHSTGGVGDKTSLVLIPLLAALGYGVSKMSGRGLGHTGGTIDKLESFPNFHVEITPEQVKQQIEDIGCAIIGQSDNLVPADKILYALRDVTGTVDSIPLIASSIMSKKIALGADVILLDVKYGNGAFFKELKDSRLLAEQMIAIGKGFNKKVIVVISSMEQPLGKNIGNILEVQEAMETLNGNGNSELLELCLFLAAQYLMQEKEISLVDAKKEALMKIKDKSAYNKLRELIEIQGGTFIPEDKFQNAKYIEEVKASQAGFINEIIANNIGTAAMLIGAGRKQKEDIIDLQVGLELVKKVGDSVQKNETIVKIHYNSKENLQECIELITNSYIIKEKQIGIPELIKEVII